MEVKNLEQVLIPANHKVNPTTLLGARLEDVELADLITVATTVKSGAPTVSLVIRPEVIDDGNQQFL